MARLKKRLDILLVERGLCETRNIAQSLIFRELVKVNGRVVQKPGTGVPEDSVIEIEESSPRYVSRGGFKLEHALKIFDIDVKEKVALDIGASTGGFTHCLLTWGARKVFAVDVGKGQLDYSLRMNPKVVSLEKKNARYLESADIPEPVNIITIDISFISLRKVLCNLKRFLDPGGLIIALVKPQFEAGRINVKKGVVKDPRIHREVVGEIIKFAAACDLVFKKVAYSPLRGPSGNIEYFVLLHQGKDGLMPEYGEEVEKTVALAHQILLKA